MFLSDIDILKEIENGNIICDPFESANLSNSSIDLRLGQYLHKYSSHFPVSFNLDPSGKLEALNLPDPKVYDLTTSNYVLYPGQFILGHTIEYVGQTNRSIVSDVGDKSTLARLGISICFSAGFIDAGNALSITLEIKNNGDVPIELQYGMHIAQIRFSYLNSEVSKPYNGKYKNSSIVEGAK